MGIDTLTQAKVGQPANYKGLQIFPVTFGSGRPDGVRIADDTLQVSELDSATVPQLQVHNPGTVPLLIPAGRVLEGGRQTRTVNVSILVPAGATMVIPVSCVEAGRWSGGQVFRQSGRQLSRKARIAKERGVKSTLEYGRSLGADLRAYKQSDQGAVWDAVASELGARHMSSATNRFDEVFEAVETNDEAGRILDEVIAKGPDDGQTGVAIAFGGRIAGVETFANPDDLRANWESIVTSAILELTDAEIAALEGEATVADVEEFLRRVAEAEATEAEGSGLGTEWHVATDDFVAHALADDTGEVIHAYAFAEI
jgi:hypothetical protein